MVVFVRRILLELGVSDDPVWAYFDGQHKYIMNQMNVSFKTALSSIRGEYHCRFSFSQPICITCRHARAKFAPNTKPGRTQYIVGSAIADVLYRVRDETVRLGCWYVLYHNHCNLID